MVLKLGVWVVLAMALLVGNAARAQETQLKVEHARTYLSEGVYYLHADLHYRLGSVLDEALHSGVALTFEAQIQIIRPRDWWLNVTSAELSLRYRLEYQPLTRLYVLTHLNTGVKQTFFRLSSALHAMGKIDRVPLLDAALLNADEAYRARMRSRLLFDALPLPLRVRGYIGREWSPSSDWYTWPLR